MQQPNRYGSMFGARGDGQQVPGNEPGGVNGSYGAYGQTPDVQPPDTPPLQSKARYGMPGMSPMQTMKSNFQHSPGGQMIHSMMHAGHPQQALSSMAAPVGMGQPAMPQNTDDPGAPAETQSSAAPASPNMAGQIASSGRMGMDDPGNPMMKDGGVVTKPTLVMLAEHGQPEAVVPLDGHAGSKVTPGMFSKARYRPATGPAMVHGPIRPMAPAVMDEHMNGGKKSGWAKYNASHPHS